MRRISVPSLAPLFLVTAVAAAQSALPSEALTRVVPVVSSTPGKNGSFFRTGLQIHNSGTSGPLSGHLVYHPANAGASTGDPSKAFSVQAGATLSYEDIVATIGRDGLGSLDVMLPSASASPIVVVTRVYDDAGELGSSGFTEDAVDPSDSAAGGAVLTRGTSGVLVAPADLSAFRFNIGLRTLSAGVSLTILVRDAGGVVQQVNSRQYGSDYFQQSAADALLGRPLAANDSIEFKVLSGSVIVYGATIDNTTNDPSFQYARVLPPLL